MTNPTSLHYLQTMFAHLLLGRSTCYWPEQFWNAFKDYDGEPVNVREHEDAYEFFTRLQVQCCVRIW